MTANEITQAAIIQALPWLMPPKGVIHVGIGAGTGPMQKWRDADVTTALIIDANLPKLNWLNTELQNHPHWQVQQAILSAQEEKADFHTANNPMESGLCPPSLFNNFWPNLAATTAESLPSKSLDALLQETDTVAEYYDWLCVDCFPSLEILKGAERQLKHLNVVWARVILNPQADQVEYGLSKLEDYLVSQGFKRSLIVEENHPALASVLFMRDWSVNLNQLKTAYDKLAVDYDAVMKLAENREAQNQQLAEDLEIQARLVTNSQQQIEQLKQESEEQAKLLEKGQAKLINERDTLFIQLTDSQSKVEALSQSNAALEQEKSMLIGRHNVLEDELAMLIKARDEQIHLLDKRQLRIESLTQECFSNAKLLAERQSKIEVFTQVNATLEQEKSALIASSDGLANEVAALKNANDEQVQLATERQSRIDFLTQQHELNTDQANDRQSQIEVLTQTNATLEQEKSLLITNGEGLMNEVAALKQVSDEQAKLVIEQQSHIEALTQANVAISQEKSTLVERLDALADEITALAAARDEQVQLATQRQSFIETLTQEIDAYAVKVNEHQLKIEALLEANSTLEQEKLAALEKRDTFANEADVLILARDQQISIATQRTTEIEHLQNQLRLNQELITTLESELVERDARQHMLNEEMLKAEAQIDLIKDLLLMGPGL